ncbi:MAG: septal ring lytic transglycosylase RlpA family protein [Bacteroidota bacterium]
MRIFLLLAFTGLSNLLAAQTFQWDSDAQTTPKSPTAITTEERGIATFYPDYYEGSPTALGETYYGSLMTAAHQTLPLGTMVQVTRPDNGMNVTVRINDRGAYCDGCIISLSKAAAAQINLLSVGQMEVDLKVLYSGQAEAMASSNPAAQEERFTARTVATDQRPNSYDAPAAKKYCPPKTATPASYNDTPQRQARGIPATTVANASNDDIEVIEAPFSPYLVQLGSYRKLPYAERHVRRLQTEGFNNVFLFKEEQTDGSILNRVIVAPFQHLSDAKAYAADLDSYHDMRGLVFQATMVEIRD